MTAGWGTREEHLAICKRRALEYLDAGDVHNAVASMLSDLSKHDETAGVNNGVAMRGLLYVRDHDVAGARRWIEGFR